MSEADSSAAVKAAYQYLLKVSPDASRFSNFRVEEISLDSIGDGSFLITLSYEIAGDFGFDKKKEYKDFKVQSDGNVAWMKIRIV